MFGCHKKGHVISECPDKKNKKLLRVIQAKYTIHSTSTDRTATDPCIRVLITTKEDDAEDNYLAKLVEPT